MRFLKTLFHLYIYIYKHYNIIPWLMCVLQVSAGRVLGVSGDARGSGSSGIVTPMHLPLRPPQPPPAPAGGDGALA